MAYNPPPDDRRRHPLEGSQPVRPPAPPPRATPLRLPHVPPYVTYGLIAVNVAVFLARAASPTLDAQLFNWGANEPVRVLLEGEVYRLFTAMFLHAGIHDALGRMVLSNAMHIILNMFILFSAGPALESLFGHARFALVYLLGGLMGSALSAALGAPNSASVGASGAVFAILAAEFIFLWRHRPLLGPRANAQMRSLLTWALINFAFGALTSVAGTRVRIDNWGHLGGALGGLALAWLIGPVFRPRLGLDATGALSVDDENPLGPRAATLLLYAAALALVLMAGRARLGV